MGSSHDYDVVVINDFIVDLIVELSEFPKPEKTLISLRVERNVGGNGNFSIMASRLGLKVKAIGCVGNDSNGFFLKNTLSREGVDTRDIVVKSGTTKMCLALVCRGSKSFIGLFNEKTVFLRPEDIGEEMFNSRALYFSGYSLAEEISISERDAVFKAFNICMRRGLEIFFDASPLINKVPREILNPILMASKILFFNVDELVKLTEEASINASVERLRSITKAIIVVKLGEKGALVYHNDKFINVDAIEVSPVDTTGAGDAFNAAFIYCYMNGFTLEKALLFANAVGALTVKKFGAGTNLPNIMEIKAFIEAKGLSKLLNELLSCAQGG